MNDQHDFSALRDLLALQRQDFPQDTQVEEFLTEFHRRQRAQLFVRRSLWASSVAWLKGRIAGFDLVPALSYAGVAAAIALTAFVGLSQQVAVSKSDDGQIRFSYRMPSHASNFAMLSGTPLLSSSSVSPKFSDSTNFASGHGDSVATRYVLASNPGTNDATVAF